MTDIDELRQMARSPQHYSNYTLAGALHGVLDRLEAAEARAIAAEAEVERLRHGLDRFADATNWWQVDTVNVHGDPVTVDAWRFGSRPWQESQYLLDNDEP